MLQRLVGRQRPPEGIAAKDTRRSCRTRPASPRPASACQWPGFRRNCASRRLVRGYPRCPHDRFFRQPDIVNVTAPKRLVRSVVRKARSIPPPRRRNEHLGDATPNRDRSRGDDRAWRGFHRTHGASEDHLSPPSRRDFSTRPGPTHRGPSSLGGTPAGDSGPRHPNQRSHGVGVCSGSGPRDDVRRHSGRVRRAGRTRTRNQAEVHEAGPLIVPPRGPHRPETTSSRARHPDAISRVEAGRVFCSRRIPHSGDACSTGIARSSP